MSGLKIIIAQIKKNKIIIAVPIVLLCVVLGIVFFTSFTSSTAAENSPSPINSFVVSVGSFISDIGRKLGLPVSFLNKNGSAQAGSGNNGANGSGQSQSLFSKLISRGSNSGDSNGSGGGGGNGSGGKGSSGGGKGSSNGSSGGSGTSSGSGGAASGSGSNNNTGNGTNSSGSGNGGTTTGGSGTTTGGSDSNGSGGSTNSGSGSAGTGEETGGSGGAYGPYRIIVPDYYVKEAQESNMVIMISVTDRVAPGNAWIQDTRKTIGTYLVDLPGTLSGNVVSAWLEPATPQGSYIYQFVLTEGNHAGDEFAQTVSNSVAKPGYFVYIYDGGFLADYMVIDTNGNRIFSSK